MRMMLVLGAGLLAASLGSASSFAANPNVPTYSPYTLMEVNGSVPDLVRTSKPVATDQQIEGRAAYERPAFPMTLLPWYW
jgi:hypothetical protein